MNKKIALLVLSFDGFDDLWNICTKLFHQNWPDCHLDKYLMTNFKDYKDSSQINPFNVLKIGEDKSWSQNLITALDELENYDYVLLFMDDGLLVEKVDDNLFNDIVDSFVMIDGKFLSFLNEPKPNIKFNQYFGEIHKDSPYRGTATSALWDLKFLRSFLDKEEDAWGFEKIGARRAELYDSGFYSVHEDVFKFIHGIVKGMWLPESFKSIRKMGFDLSKNKRGIFSKFDIYKMYIYSFIRKLIFFITPFKFHKYLIRK